MVGQGSPVFHSRSPKTVLNNISLTFYLTEQHHICTSYYKNWRVELNRKESNERLYKKSFENKLCGFVYTHKRPIFASIKILQCKLLPLSEAK